MRFPNHIILDLSNASCHHSSKYWIFNFINTNDMRLPFSMQKSFLKFKTSSFLLKKIGIKKARGFTLRYSLHNPLIYLSDTEKTKYKKLFASRKKVINKLFLSKHIGKIIFHLITFKTSYKDHVYVNLWSKRNNKDLKINFKTSNLWNVFNLNFIKKEKLYTKLKYSRTPQYDMVSGGVAAVFAGFLGFLICEKFGLELLDSGDFYFLFMYAVFLCFFVKLLLKLINGENSFWNVFSYKWFFSFYKNICFLFFNIK